MNMQKPLTRVFFLACTCILLSACGNNDYRLSAKDMAAFKDATPEMKLEWEKGLKADKANDYLAASTNFRSLLSQNITPDQLVALQTALGGLNERMNNAAAKGLESRRAAAVIDRSQQRQDQRPRAFGWLPHSTGSRWFPLRAYVCCPNGG
jgi:hypothetical protein